jgi:hypothetical protein
MRKLLLQVRRDGFTVLNVYRIKRNPQGVLTCHLEGERHRSEWRLVEQKPEEYAMGLFCAHNRRASNFDLCRAAGLDENTPPGIVRDWYEENLPLDTKVWRRLERKRLKREAVDEMVERHNRGVVMEALLSASS